MAEIHLSQIESSAFKISSYARPSVELPPNMHLPIPSSDPFHFYRYLRSHMLVEESQFLLLINVPIQDRAQQI